MPNYGCCLSHGVRDPHWTGSKLVSDDAMSSFHDSWPSIDTVKTWSGSLRETGLSIPFYFHFCFSPLPFLQKCDLFGEYSTHPSVGSDVSAARDNFDTYGTVVTCFLFPYRIRVDHEPDLWTAHRLLSARDHSESWRMIIHEASKIKTRQSV